MGLLVVFSWFCKYNLVCLFVECGGAISSLSFNYIMDGFRIGEREGLIPVRLSKNMNLFIEGL